MKNWSQIEELFNVEDTLYKLTKESIERFIGSADEMKDLKQFELFCNTKYGYIFLSFDTKEFPENSEAKSTHPDESQMWKYFQYNTDTEGIRDLWREDWEVIRKYISNEVYDEYLDLLNEDEAKANATLAANEKGLKEMTERVYKKIVEEVISKLPDLSLRPRITFQEEFY